MSDPLLAAARLMTDSLRVDATPEDIRARVEAARGLDWDLLAHHADGHTLAPLLHDLWAEAGALAHVPPATAERLARARRDNAARTANIRRDLLEVHALLEGAGVPHVVLKGWPLAERLYADPAQRYMSDQDFLVPEDRAAAGHAALRAAGYRPLPVKDEWIEKHLPSLWRNDGYPWSGYLYDPDYPRPAELHVRLWERGWRGLAVRDMPGLWADARTCTVAGLALQVLSDEHTAVHLAMHFAGHLVEREARLNQLLDLARLLHTTPALDRAKVVDLAEAAGVARFVYVSIYLAHAIYGAPLPTAAAWRVMEARTPRPLQAWLAGEGVDDTLAADYRRRAKGQDYRLTFMAATSVREYLGVVRFALFPPLGQLAAKYRVPRALAAFTYPRHVAERVRSYWRSRGEGEQVKG
jgi:hypothetical protein